MSTTQIEKSEYQILDDADAQQIAQADQAVKQALAYEIKTPAGMKKQLSYAGIKWLVLNMSQKGQSLQIVDKEVKLEKSPLDDTYTWYATVTVRNRETGLETVGTQESPYIERGQYDRFGRTKALSKAVRNAYRQQIPELEIQAMLGAIDPSNVEKIVTTAGSPPQQHTTVQVDPNIEGPSDKQVQFLRNLCNWHGMPVEIPASKYAAMEKIKELDAAKKAGNKLGGQQ